MSANDPTPHPLTANQQGELGFDRHIGSAPYHDPVLVRLRGSLQVGAVQAAVAEVVRRHESLRTRFVVIDGEDRQVVDPPGSRPLPWIDLAGLAPAQQEQALRRIGRDELSTPFDLAEGTAVRWALIHLALDHHALLVSPHHIAADMWSMGVLAADFTAAYVHAAAGTPPPLGPPPMQPAQWAHLEQKRWSPERVAEAVAPWRAALEQLPAPNLPADHRPDAATWTECWLEHADLGVELSEGVRELSRRRGVTVFVVLLAAFQCMLARACDVERLVTCSLTARRDRRDTAEAVGIYADFLRVMAHLPDDLTFAQVLARTSEAVLDAQEDQHLPGEWLLRGTEVDGVQPHPLEHAGLNLYNTPPVELRGLGEALCSVVEPDERPIGPTTTCWRGNVFIDAYDFGAGSIVLDVGLAKDLFNEDAPARWARLYRAVIAQATAGDHVPLSQLPVHPPGYGQDVTPLRHPAQ